MIISIVGSRTFKNFDELENYILRFVKIENIDAVVSGGATGADTLGRKFAEKYDIELFEILPEWKKYGKAAGMIRNDIIISNSEIVFTFWDGKSKGTYHSISLAKKYSKELHVYRF